MRVAAYDATKPRRIVHFGGVAVDAWESFFLEKSRRRRARSIVRERAIKSAVLILLAASIGTAVYAEINGLAG